MFRQRTIIFLLLCLLPISYSQASGSRVALVIGNGKYQDTGYLPELANPTNDAKDIAAALRGFNFEVIENKNLSHESMDAAIADFDRKISNSEAALFYFAGHGLQVKGQNYLIPVDAKIESEEQVAYKSINVNQILEVMDNAKSHANIVILDACRNNPISGKFRSGAARGLAAPSSQPKGTVIVYATDPGNTAADGEGRNGLFTAGLLAAFKGNDLSLQGVLTRASEKVEQDSNQTQSPYINGPPTIQKNFLFAPGSAPVPGQNQPTVSPALDPASMELSFWDSIKDSGDPADFEEYLKQYTAGRFAGLAHNRIKQLKTATARPEPAPIAIRPEPAAYAPPASACADCPEMVQIPGGSFMMGSSSPEQDGKADEEPRHPVQVGRFALGKYEVTRQQFAAFVDETGYSAGSSCETYESAKWELRSGRNWQNPAFNQSNNHPVVCISHDDAMAYIRWLGQKTGQRYRLPTEAEWEYAARAGNETARYWGDGSGNACAYANVGDQTVAGHFNWDASQLHACADGYATTAPVGSFQANAFGLHDMLGNVNEWTCSAYTENGYDGSEKTCTNNASSRRVFRGGSWDCQPALVRSALRGWNDVSSRPGQLTLPFMLFPLSPWMVCIPLTRRERVRLLCSARQRGRGFF